MRVFATVGLCVALLGCDSPEAPSRAEHDALLQRLDAMEQRIDELEDAAAKGAEESAAPLEDEVLYRDTITERAIAVGAPDLKDPFARPATPTATLSVRLSRRGIEVDGVLLSQREAAERFKTEAKRSPPPRLMLLAEPEVDYKATVELLDLARQNGLSDVAITATVHGER